MRAYFIGPWEIWFFGWRAAREEGCWFHGPVRGVSGAVICWGGIGLRFVSVTLWSKTFKMIRMEDIP